MRYDGCENARILYVRVDNLESMYLKMGSEWRTLSVVVKR